MPWPSRNQHPGNFKLFWTDADITTLVTKGPSATDRGNMESGASIEDIALLWAVCQLLPQTVCQPLRHTPKTEERNGQLIMKSDIPLTTLSILLCDSCGIGYVIGWLDWSLQDGKLVGGTMPID